MAESGRFQTGDPSEFELALDPWDVIVEPSERGEQSYELEYLSMPGLMLYRERYARTVRLSGKAPARRLPIALVGPGPNLSRVFGSSVLGDHIYALGGDVLEASYGPGHTQLVLELDLEHHPEDQVGLVLERLTSDRSDPHLSRLPMRDSGLQHTVLRALGMASRGGPADLPHRFEAVRSEVLDALAHTVLPYSLDLAAGRRSVQTAAVSRMLDYLCTPGNECYSVSDLCRSLGVNQRTLERAVRDRYDCTVVQFLRRWRLRATRRRLIVLGPGETTVSDIAVSQGFFDLGRFATSYRQEFGEYPSDTLKSPARSGNARLAWA